MDADVISYAAGFSSETKIYVAEDEDGNVLGESTNKEWLQSRNTSCTVSSYVQPQSASIAEYNADTMVRRILSELGKHIKVDSYQLYLTGGGNFRDNLATIQPYKGNRVAPRPYHFQTIRDFLVREWGAEVVEGVEADDKVSIKAWGLLLGED